MAREDIEKFKEKLQKAGKINGSESYWWIERIAKNAAADKGHWANQ